MRWSGVANLRRKPLLALCQRIAVDHWGVSRVPTLDVQALVKNLLESSVQSYWLLA
ncbi:hypothetical protein D3C81_961710 [compost metagenome]